MKITKLRAVGPSIVDFPLVYEEPEGPFVLKGSEGLGPVEVDVLDSGERRPRVREITLLVGLQPSWDTGQTAEQLRTMLYDLMTPRYGAPIQLRLMDGETQQAYADCQVKKMEIGVHTADPEVQIVLGCVGASRSYFIAPQVTLAPSIPAPVGGFTVVDFDNIGTAPSGFQIGMQFTSAVPNVTITDNHAGGQMMKVNRAFAIGERLIINTAEAVEPVLGGSGRGVWYTPAGGGALLPIVNEFDVASDWMQLHRGTNQINVNAPFTWYSGGIRYVPAYWGV